MYTDQARQNTAAEKTRVQNLMREKMEAGIDISINENSSFIDTYYPLVDKQGQDKPFRSFLEDAFTLSGIDPDNLPEADSIVSTLTSAGFAGELSSAASGYVISVPRQQLDKLKQTASDDMREKLYDLYTSNIRKSTGGLVNLRL